MKVVLHICCGVCAAGVVERLRAEGHQVLGFFYNPNIHPGAEYERRLAVARRVAAELDFPLEVPPYRPEVWFRETASLEEEPEGGRRCEVCFRHRLEQAVTVRRPLQEDPATNAYRLVNAESDFLPGLVVDRYNEYLVIQFLTLGIQRWKREIVCYGLWG